MALSLSRQASRAVSSALNANINASSVIATRGFASEGDTQVDLELPRKFLLHNLESGPNQTIQTSKNELLQMYEKMVLMRRMEIAADVLYKSKLIRGFCHLYDGQEAVAVGMEAVLTKVDSIVTSYRDHCIYLIRGGNPTEVIAELMGRTAGATLGLGGSMHMYNKEWNMYGGHGIVGAQIPVGAGLALKHKYSKDGGVSVAMYGDGAANQGQGYEAMNIAAIWDLPCIFVCENNRFGMGTSAARISKSQDFYKRGGFVPGMKVDGMDVLAVKQAMGFAKEYVSKNGPMIIEMDTYRYHGHSMSDPGTTYRSRDEINELREKRDPIERVKALMLEKFGVTTPEVKAIDRKVKEVIDGAVETAKASAYPDPKTAMFKNVFAKVDAGYKVRGLDSSQYHVLPTSS